MKVLLGVCDDRIPETTKTSFDTNKIGGLPTWPGVDVDVPTCERCGRLLCLVVQVYCPLDSSPYHRIIYVYGCITPTCCNHGNSWKVLRCQALDPSYQAKTVPLATSSSLHDDTSVDCWGDDADDWGDDDDDDVIDDKLVSMVTDQPKMISVDTAQKCASGSADREKCDAEIEGFQRLTVDDSSLLHSETRESEVVGEGEEGQSTGQSKDSDSVDGCIAEDIPLEHVQTSILMSLVDLKYNRKDTQNGMNNDVLPDAGTLDKDMLPDISRGPSQDKTPANQMIGVCGATQSLPAYYLSVFEEPSLNIDHKRELVEPGSRWELVEVDVMIPGGSSGGEKYEKTEVKHGDKTFHKFKKKLSNCPEQILRYCYKGEPLHIQDCHQVAAHCTCGAPRVLEFQLMPALVNLLRFRPHDDVAMEFGTILVYSCEASCWDDNATWRTEVALLETDPDQNLFKT